MRFDRGLIVLARRQAAHTPTARIQAANRRLDKLMGRLAAVGTNPPGGAA